MLRKCLHRIAFHNIPLGIMVFVCCLLSASVVHAATQTEQTLPRLSEIYPNASNETAADVEFVELYNASVQNIDMSRYSLRIKGSTTKNMRLSGTLAAESYQSFVPTFTLVNTGSTIQLVQKSTDDTEQVIEEVTYGDSSKAAFKTQSWSYFIGGWESTPITRDAVNIHFSDEEMIDVCPVTPEIDVVVPVGYKIDESGICIPIVVVSEDCHIEISEISAQPNYDGKEYIEFYNPSDKVALLEHCKIKINGGSEKIVGSIELVPQARYVMSFSSGAIRNTSGTITLINSDNVEAEYSYQDTSSGEVNNFTTGSLSGVVSNHPTPDAVNIPADSSSEAVQPTVSAKTVTSSVNTVTPCAPGKFRNPETNRCKNIATTANEVAPCAADQVRNPATNRCKKAATASASLTPCQPDQVRNPATNRCKKSTTATSDLKPCAENQERNPETNRCRKVATDVSGTVLGAAADPASVANSSYKIPAAILSVTALFGYALYEYRSDISRRFTSLREKRRPLRPPD